ncbi:MAG: hypothetical protein ACU0A2_05445 [Cognatishimia sp.]|uniref:hypothetical protein n=1 Tax=Cognatishimia sp. TaxID=2211648 RepID=UPI004058ABBE
MIETKFPEVHLLDTEPRAEDPELSFHSDFPQVKIPFQATIAGVQMDGISLSQTKALVQGVLPEHLDYQDDLISLRFDFDGFSISLFADAILAQDRKAPNAPIAAYFSQPTDAHFLPLRYLVNSFLAGDVVTVGQLLSTGAQEQDIEASPDRPPKPRSKLRLLALWAMGPLLIYLVSQLFLSNALYTYGPHPVVFAHSEQALRATVSGQIVALNPNARAGEIGYTLMGNTGELVSPRMPCNCLSEASEGVFVGATVMAGEPVLNIRDRHAPIEATVTLSQRGLAHHLAGARAELLLRDGRVVPVELATRGKDAATMAADVRLPDLPDITDGDIARLRFNRLPAALGRAAHSFKSRMQDMLNLGKT